VISRVRNQFSVTAVFISFSALLLKAYSSGRWPGLTRFVSAALCEYFFEKKRKKKKEKKKINRKKTRVPRRAIYIRRA
jgi:hypothetical protein